MSLSPEQVKIIKSTVPILRDHGKEICLCFYENLLREVPELNNVFSQTNQLNGKQAGALAGSLYAYADHIDDLGVLSPVIERINQKHASLHIRPEQYDTVGTYLLRAMKEILGDALTPAVHDAWAVAYQQLANVMIKREDQLLKEADGWTDWRDFSISQKIQESSEITSFYLVPLDRKPLPSYLPGQYISVRVSVPDLSYLQARQYSLSDAPNPNHYRISVKKELGLDLGQSNAKAHPGYVSNVLHDKSNVGDVLQVSHPAGEFFLDVRKEENSDNPVVLISAGVGLTPNLSILNTLVSKDTRRKVSWIHATRDSQAHAFSYHIQETTKTHDNVQSHVFNRAPGNDSREGVDYQFKGRMSLDKLDTDHDLFILDSKTEYYVCGPQTFMTDMGQVLGDWGVGPERIKMELFGTGEIPVA